MKNLRSRHTYQEISHFRAPYRNVPVAGFGTAPPPPGNTMTNEEIMQYIDKDSQGRYHYKPEVAEALMQKLTYAGYVHMSNTNGAVYYYNQQQRSEMDQNTAAGAQLKAMSGAAAVKSWIDNNMVVVASIKLLLGGEGDIEIGAIDASKPEAVTAATVEPYGMIAPILAMPDAATKSKLKDRVSYISNLTNLGPKEAGVSYLTVGLVAAGALGLGYVVFRKKR